MEHRLELPDGFCLNYTNVTRDKIGPLGLTVDELASRPEIGAAMDALAVMRRSGDVRGHDEKVYFTRLAYQEGDAPDRLRAIAEWGADVRSRCRAVVSLGIGGSYLGNQVLADALLSPLWNSLAGTDTAPRLFFSGNNVDPQSIRDLDRILDLERTMFVVISKSGTTTETMAAFLHFYNRCRAAGLDPGRHFTAVTDPERGILLQIARQERLPLFQVPPGVGGRFSVLTDVGLLVDAAAGIAIPELLGGARAMVEAADNRDLLRNPPCLYAAICHELYRRAGIHEAVLMPYSDRLRSFALWYVQLLAESLGKEKNRRGETVHEGRTPIAAVGTSDMHAQTQQHQGGKKNKLVTTIAVEDFGDDEITLPREGPWTRELAFVAGRSFGRLLRAARVANEEALAADGRPSCAIDFPRLSPYTLGQLFLFFELATAFEGELLDVNAFDQPGAENYKKLMKELLR